MFVSGNPYIIPKSMNTAFLTGRHVVAFNDKTHMWYVGTLRKGIETPTESPADAVEETPEEIKEMDKLAVYVDKWVELEGSAEYKYTATNSPSLLSMSPDETHFGMCDSMTRIKVWNTSNGVCVHNHVVANDPSNSALGSVADPAVFAVTGYFVLVGVRLNPALTRLYTFRYNCDTHPSECTHLRERRDDDRYYRCSSMLCPLPTKAKAFSWDTVTITSAYGVGIIKVNVPPVLLCVHLIDDMYVNLLMSNNTTLSDVDTHDQDALRHVAELYSAYHAACSKFKDVAAPFLGLAEAYTSTFDEMMVWSEKDGVFTCCHPDGCDSAEKEYLDGLVVRLNQGVAPLRTLQLSPLKAQARDIVWTTSQLTDNYIMTFPEHVFTKFDGVLSLCETEDKNHLSTCLIPDLGTVTFSGKMSIQFLAKNRDDTNDHDPTRTVLMVPNVALQKTTPKRGDDGTVHRRGAPSSSWVDVMEDGLTVVTHGYVNCIWPFWIRSISKDDTIGMQTAIMTSSLFTETYDQAKDTVPEQPPLEDVLEALKKATESSDMEDEASLKGLTEALEQLTMSFKAEDDDEDHVEEEKVDVFAGMTPEQRREVQELLRPNQDLLNKPDKKAVVDLETVFEFDEDKMT